jgi:heme-binding NEAT domain protein
MRIKELFEAIGTIGSTTDPLQPNGLPKTGAPAGTIPPAPGTQPVATTPPNPNAPKIGQQPQQQTATGSQPVPINPALQQGMKTTMTDLDKIAAQIVGLKQKQQQMQQQMQQPTP